MIYPRPIVCQLCYVISVLLFYLFMGWLSRINYVLLLLYSLDS